MYEDAKAWLLAKDLGAVVFEPEVEAEVDAVPIAPLLLATADVLAVLKYEFAFAFIRLNCPRLVLLLLLLLMFDMLLLLLLLLLIADRMGPPTPDPNGPPTPDPNDSACID